MARGKQTCKILKEIRKQISAENDIEFVTSECTYKGDCLGTCPKCESEVRYLERELEKRQRLGKAAVFAGMSLGTLLTAAACDTTAKVPSNPSCKSGTQVTLNDSIPERRLEGDVVALTPEPQKPDTIDEPLMGIFPMYRNVYTFDVDVYQSLLESRFVFPRMENLKVVGGEILYEYVRPDGKPCESLEELAKTAKEFSAPCYPDGEHRMLLKMDTQLEEVAANYKGEMEVAFTVTPSGAVQDVEIVKGIDGKLDSAVKALFEDMKWQPAEYELKDGSVSRFECRCVQKIPFPIPIILDEPIMGLIELNEENPE